MVQLKNFLYLMLKTAMRDRMLHALFLSGIMLFLLVPSFSLFSMRQVQELSITLSLSAISFILLVFSIFLGSSSIWRDIEKRYTTSVLGLPISRSSYVLGKFISISIFIVICALLLALVSIAVINISSAQYKSSIPVLWGNIVAAIVADVLKYILLSAFAILFSSFSTSFFFPFFATIGIYLAGSASQEVAEYVASEYGKSMLPFVRWITQGIYYVLPNFAAFNLKVQAIYSLPLSVYGLAYTFMYFIVYTAIVLSLSIWMFARRELP